MCNSCNRLDIAVDRVAARLIRAPVEHHVADQLARSPYRVLPDRSRRVGGNVEYLNARAVVVAWPRRRRVEGEAHVAGPRLVVEVVGRLQHADGSHTCSAVRGRAATRQHMSCYTQPCSTVIVLHDSREDGRGAPARRRSGWSRERGCASRPGSPGRRSCHRLSAAGRATVRATVREGAGRGLCGSDHNTQGFVESPVWIACDDSQPGRTRKSSRSPATFPAALCKFLTATSSSGSSVALCCMNM